MNNNMTFGDCPFCSRGFIFYPESYESFRECPVCGGKFYVGEPTSNPIVSERELVPDLGGRSFEADGFVVENGVLVRYEGDKQFIEIPNDVLAIGKGAFRGNTRIKSVDIKSGVLYIGERAFEDCDGIRTLLLPSTLLTIANNAFKGLRRLTSVNIPASLVACGYATFQECHNLKTLYFPMDMKYMGGSPFRYCRALQGANIPNCVNDELDIWLTDVTSLEKLTIGANVRAFRCTWLGQLKSLEFVNPNGWVVDAYKEEDCKKIDAEELKNPKKTALLIYRLAKENKVLRRPDAKPSYDYHLKIE